MLRVNNMRELRVYIRQCRGKFYLILVIVDRQGDLETVAKHHEMVWARGSVNTKHSLVHGLKRNLYSV